MKIKMSSMGPFLIVMGCYIGVAAFVFDRINFVQPQPYMDEIFHVPQTQKYCNGTFNKWDPKITTLPGTYLAATGIIGWLPQVGLVSEACSVYQLRVFNVGVSSLNLILVYVILNFYMPNASDFKRAFAALNIVCFPVLYFFSFLFYTDTTSTALVLMTHLLFLQKKYKSSAFLGGLAIFTRQTNVIWVIWHGLLSGWDLAATLVSDFYHEAENVYENKTEAKRNSARKTNVQITDLRKFFQPDRRVNSAKLMLELIWEKVWKKDVPGATGLYGLVVLLFCVFVIINGGIVVGDKQAHQVTMNLPQIGYFSLVFSMFCQPFILRRLMRTLRFGTDNFFLLVLVLSLGLIAVRDNTVAHPYLLADNRHYTFYIWKRFFQTYVSLRFWLVPAYVLCWCFLWVSMDASLAYRLAFLICCCLNLIPQMLLEFRYFIPCYLFARLVIRDVKWPELILELIIYSAINVFTVYMFLYKPFLWPDVNEPQRFMW